MTDIPEPTTPRRTLRGGVPLMILLGSLGGLIGVGALLYLRATGNTNHVALAATPKGVTMVAAVAQPFQERRRYVGTIEPWVQAKIGPQMVSAYVDTVLVRPGAVVKRGDVIATLDCRNASAASRAVAASARALEATRTASANEAARISGLLDGKYVSQNEVDLKKADAASKEAQFASMQAQMLGTSLQVDDCVLRAPFDGEIAERQTDPGAFARPGSAIATEIDRHLVRITADVPEDDFGGVAPGTQVRIHLIANGRELAAPIARRSPSADPGTRTVHIEIDVDDAARDLPVWTTAELSIDVGQAIPATAIPLAAAAVHGSKVTVVRITDGVAHTTRAKLIGERYGTFYLDPSLPAGSLVVTEGRGVVDDLDHVSGKTAAWSP